MTGPLALYRRRVERGELAADLAQARAAEALERLYRDLQRASSRRGWRAKLAKVAGRRSAPVRGLYLWGSVGRGKTLLMDLFFEALPFPDKRRQHFHRFMAGVHERLKVHRNVEEPLESVAEEIAGDTRVICFDELSVTDIADAMLLGNLFAGLFARGVTLAATSNLAPGQLYKGGLQRQRFLPTIALLKERCEVVHLDGGVDYRLRTLEQAELFHSPLDEEADISLRRSFDALAVEAGKHSKTMEINGRKIPAKAHADDVVWFDFKDVCDGPRNQNDYIELARQFHAIIISNVPVLGGDKQDQSRRFINMIDEFYDRNVKVIISAAAPITELYSGGRLGFEFERTESRLLEMQSREYLEAAHKP